MTPAMDAVNLHLTNGRDQKEKNEEVVNNYFIQNHINST